MSPRILPADVYDALELSALAFGGIGAGWYWKGGPGTRPKNPIPLCIVGHAGWNTEVEDALLTTDTWVGSSDDAVRRINQRLGAPSDARVPFAAWCAELGVERGT